MRISNNVMTCHNPGGYGCLLKLADMRHVLERLKRTSGTNVYSMDGDVTQLASPRLFIEHLLAPVAGRVAKMLHFNDPTHTGVDEERHAVRVLKAALGSSLERLTGYGHSFEGDYVFRVVLDKGFRLSIRTGFEPAKRVREIVLIMQNYCAMDVYTVVRSRRGLASKCARGAWLSQAVHKGVTRLFRKLHHTHVHGDIKPSNLISCSVSACDIRVIDYGLMQAVTKQMEWLGTPGYRSFGMLNKRDLNEQDSPTRAMRALASLSQKSWRKVQETGPLTLSEWWRKNDEYSLAITCAECYGDGLSVASTYFTTVLAPLADYRVHSQWLTAHHHLSVPSLKRNTLRHPNLRLTRHTHPHIKGLHLLSEPELRDMLQANVRELHRIREMQLLLEPPNDSELQKIREVQEMQQQHLLLMLRRKRHESRAATRAAARAAAREQRLRQESPNG